MYCIVLSSKRECQHVFFRYTNSITENIKKEAFNLLTLQEKNKKKNKGKPQDFYTSL